MNKATDSHYMKMALSLAQRGLGQTSPNPAVGCVILDKAGHIVGRGYTGRGGRPHAETEALSYAGDGACGGTAYVTLEPCAHQGQTPACAEALVTAQLSRVVVATGDPDHRVSGQGLNILKKAGIDVVFGICQQEADELNEGFFKRILHNRPMVTMKIATSLDGKIATKSGQSKWITCADSRGRGHLLRANHDAILVGSGTVEADDPTLDCRLSGLEDRSPIRIIVDSRLSVLQTARLVETAKKNPTWIMTVNQSSDHRKILEAAGVMVFDCEASRDGRIDLSAMMGLLAREGITRVLSEGGAELNASLIRASLVDRLYWFRSAKIIGGDGLSAIGSINVSELSDAAQFSLVRTGHTGNDIWQEFKAGI